MATLRINDSLNIIAGTTKRSNQDAINLIAGTTALSQQAAFNVWAGTTGLSRQACANSKAGTTALSLQDALEVLAANGAAIADPTDIAGCVLWCTADESATLFQDDGFTTPASANDDPVGGWGDLSGTTHNLTQSTSANKPLLKTNTLNGMPTILFDGGGVNPDFLKETGGFTLTQPETVYMVFKNVTYTSLDYVFDGNATNSGALYVSGAVQITLFTTGNGPSGTFAADTFRIGTFIFNGASSVLQFNNLTEATGNPGATNMGGFTLGASGSGTLGSHIQVAEVIVYSGAHTTTQRTQVKNYLSSKWAISI